MCVSCVHMEDPRTQAILAKHFTGYRRIFRPVETGHWGFKNPIDFPQTRLTQAFASYLYEERGGAGSRGEWDEATALDAACLARVTGSG